MYFVIGICRGVIREERKLCADTSVVMMHGLKYGLYVREWRCGKLLLNLIRT